MDSVKLLENAIASNLKARAYAQFLIRSGKRCAQCGLLTLKRNVAELSLIIKDQVARYVRLRAQGGNHA